MNTTRIHPKNPKKKNNEMIKHGHNERIRKRKIQNNGRHIRRTRQSSRTHRIQNLRLQVIPKSIPQIPNIKTHLRMHQRLRRLPLQHQQILHQQ